MTSVFLRSTKIVLLGMAFSQSIPLLGSLLIARLYVPTEFGLFSAWLGLVLTAALVVTGRLEMALALEQDGEPRKVAMIFTLTTSVGVCCALSIVAMGAYFAIPLFRDLPLGLVLLFLPATVLMAMLQTWQSWAAAEGKYNELSWIRIAQALGITGLQITAGWFSPDSVSLAFAHVLGVFVGVCSAAYLMPISENVKTWLNSWNTLKAFWMRHRRFPIFALPADFINAAAGQLPLLIIASKFGAEYSGLYALTVRVLGAPIGLLGASVLDVFKRSAAIQYRERGNCKEDYIRTFQALAVGGVLLALGVMLVAESLFSLAFGEAWRQAGVMAVWLMPMFVMRFVASPLSYIFYIAGKQHVDLVWQCALLLMTLVAFLLPSDFDASVKAYAIGYAFMYVIYLALSYRFSMGKHA